MYWALVPILPRPGCLPLSHCRRLLACPYPLMPPPLRACRQQLPQPAPTHTPQPTSTPTLDCPCPLVGGGYLANVAPSEFAARYELRLPQEMWGAEFLEQVQLARMRVCGLLCGWGQGASGGGLCLLRNAAALQRSLGSVSANGEGHPPMQCASWVGVYSTCCLIAPPSHSQPLPALPCATACSATRCAVRQPLGCRHSGGSGADVCSAHSRRPPNPRELQGACLPPGEGGVGVCTNAALARR